VLEIMLTFVTVNEPCDEEEALPMDPLEPEPLPVEPLPVEPLPVVPEADPPTPLLPLPVEPLPVEPEADPPTPLLPLPAPAFPEMLPLLFPLEPEPLPAPEVPEAEPLPLPIPLLSDPVMRTWWPTWSVNLEVSPANCHVLPVVSVKVKFPEDPLRQPSMLDEVEVEVEELCEVCVELPVELVSVCWLDEVEDGEDVD
jgi:hypothetical protein